MLHAGQLSNEAKQAYKIVEAQSKRIKELEEDVRTLILTSDQETINKLEEKYKHLK